MPQALDIITDALLSMNVYSPGDAISDADAEFCLSKLNDMLDSWSNESLTVFAMLTQTFPLVVGEVEYTIGPGGNWNGVRPLSIRDDPGWCYITDQQENTYAIDVINQQQWGLIGNKVITSNIPDTLFYDPQYPLGIVNIYPQPTTTYTVTFVCELALADFATLYTAVTLPPGYKKALQTNLVLDIWSAFKPEGSVPAQTFLAAASVSKGNIKRKNVKPMKAFFDPEIVSRGAPTYNYKNDTGR